MSGIKIKIDGMAKTRALLQGIANSEEEATKELVKLASGHVQQVAMRIVPVQTGNLKRSIMIDIAPDGNSAKVTANADYSAYVEYGTRYKEARPFMQPASQIVQAELNGGESKDVALRKLEESKRRLTG